MILDSCLIIKNEENNIKELINQLLIFSHEIHITDTGSTDNTLNIIKTLQLEHSNIFLHYFEWNMDFSAARNYSLTCYDCKADYQFWCDGDDRLNDKLIETLNQFVSEKNLTDDIYYIYYKYFENDNNPHIRTSILKKSANLEWKDPIHEYINISPLTKLNLNYFNNGSLLLHLHNTLPQNHNSNRNLQIFFNMEKTNHKFTGRNRYYYGTELIRAGLTEYANVQYKKCIDMDISLDIHKIYSVTALFNWCYDDTCIDYLFKVIKLGLFRKDFFVYLGNYYFDRNNHELAYIFYKNCIELPDPTDFMAFSYPKNCVIDAYLQLGLIDYNKGNFKEALEYNTKILDIIPDHNTAIKNIDILTQIIYK